jgi:hypothetical protein
MIKFTNPCPSGVSEKKSFLNKSKLKYSTQKGDKIICPYNGKITKVNSDSVVIKHVINSDEWESKLSGFYPTVSTNDKVYQGKEIGFTINGTFTFEISPNVNVEELISFGVNPSKYHGKTSKESSGKSVKSNSNDDALSGLLKIFLSPVSFVQGALNLEQEVIEKTSLIKEDINRIKKLF